MILGGLREVVCLKQEVAHCDQTWNIVSIDIETFLEGLGCMLKITSLKVDLTKFTVRFVVVLIPLKTEDEEASILLMIVCQLG